MRPGFSERPAVKRAGRLAGIDAPPGWAVAAGLSLLLVLVVGGSTVSAEWVPNSSPITAVGLIGALVIGALAVARAVPWQVSAGIGGAGGVIASYWATIPPAAHLDPFGAAGREAVGVWLGRIASGDFTDPAAFLFLLCLLLWLVGGWLIWATLRWRQPLPGLVPAVAALSTNILNYPDRQSPYVFYFIVLMPALLLWTSYRRSLEAAARAGVGASGDARWDFWETGVVVTAAVVVIGLIAPPLSVTDRTVQFESGIFSSWADLLAGLDHPVQPGPGSASGDSTGFSTSVLLGAALHRSGAIVFTYRAPSNYPGPRYFRGANLAQPLDGRWAVGSLPRGIPLPASTPPGRAEIDLEQASGTFRIDMVRPPKSAPNLLFYPGELASTSRATVASQALVEPTAGSVTAPFDTIDELRTEKGNSRGPYSVSVGYANPSDSELRAAGNAYPSWVARYRTYPTTVGAPFAADQARIRQLALRLTSGDTNDYDRATSIQDYLRTFIYTLTPPAPPAGQGALGYFLFTSQKGYCEYFATAMGDMLRLLGIPTRLVNGFGPGTYDRHLKKYVVRESDAHTWVESYFPGYGWIPFEPTPQSGYPVIERRVTQSAACPGEQSCQPAGATGRSARGVGPLGRAAGAGGNQQVGGGGGLGVGAFRIPGAPWQVPAGLLALIIAAAAVAAGRYLRPRSVGAAWRRAVRLCELAGMNSPGGDTPAETGARAGARFPELAADLRSLADNFAVAAYAPPDLAASARAGVLEAWERLRPALLRRVAQRLVPARR